MKPFISIIITIFNCEKYILFCLESILNQSYKNFELIIIDDGSKDRSPIIVKEIVSRYDSQKIKFFTQTNKGLVYSRNKALEYVTGTYIMFVDADDWLESDALEKLVNVKGNFDSILFSYYACYSNKRTIKKLESKENVELLNKEKTLVNRIIGLSRNYYNDPKKIDRFTPVWGKMYKANLIKKLNLKFESLDFYPSEALIFNIKFYRHCRSHYILNIPLYNYRKYNTNSITKKFSESFENKWLNLFLFIESLFQNSTKIDRYSIESRKILALVSVLRNFSRSKSLTTFKKNSLRILSKTEFNYSLRNLNFFKFPLLFKLFFFLLKKHLLLIPYLLFRIGL